MDPIQGSNAVLSFYGDAGWEPFVCTSSSTLTIDGDMLPIRTVGDGQWKKYEYSTMGFELSLGGVFVFSQENPSGTFVNLRGLDVVNTQLAQLSLPFRLTFTDDLSNIWTFQGTLLIKSSQITSPVGEVVKNTHTFTGSGPLYSFIGYVPCATTITGITFAGLADPSGNVTVSYTYIGDLYQVQYSVDGSANVTASGSGTINLTGMQPGAHSITITPVCSNGFQGTAMTMAFTTTQALVCNSTVTSITVDTTALTATPVFGSGSTATQYSWSIGTGVAQTVPVGTVVSLKNLAPGTYTIFMRPVCLVGSNKLFGTGTSNTFTITQQAAYGKLNYNFTRTVPTVGYSVVFNIYINNVLQISSINTLSGSIPAQVGAAIRCICSVSRHLTGPPAADSGAYLEVDDTTLGTTLFTGLDTSAIANEQFNFTMTSDTYSIIMQTSSI